MASNSLFSKDRGVYWPAEFADIVALLKGVDGSGKYVSPAFYKYNTGVMVLAAMVGLAHSRERDVGAERMEVRTEQFEAHRLGDATLAAFIFLVPLLAGATTDVLRAEHEEEVIRRFERFAAGGFEVLRGALSVTSDSTGHSVLRAEIERAEVLIVRSS